jgi:hypothetical protein
MAIIGMPPLSTDQRDQLDGPIVLVWDNLNTHLSAANARDDRRLGLVARDPATPPVDTGLAGRSQEVQRGHYESCRRSAG